MKKTIVNDDTPENQRHFHTRIQEEGRQPVYYDEIEIDDETGEKSFFCKGKILCTETYRLDEQVDKDFDLNAALRRQVFFDENGNPTFSRRINRQGIPYSATEYVDGEPAERTYESRRRGLVTDYFNKNGQRISRVEAAFQKMASGKLAEGFRTLCCQKSMEMAFNRSDISHKKTTQQQNGHIIRLETAPTSGKTLALNG